MKQASKRQKLDDKSKHLVCLSVTHYFAHPRFEAFNGIRNAELYSVSAETTVVSLESLLDNAELKTLIDEMTNPPPGCWTLKLDLRKHGDYDDDYRSPNCDHLAFASRRMGTKFEQGYRQRVREFVVKLTPDDEDTDDEDGKLNGWPFVTDQKMMEGQIVGKVMVKM